MNNQNKIKNTFIIISALLLIVLSGYYLFVNKQVTSPTSPTSPTPPIEISIKYINTQYGFSISLPDSWKGYTVVSENWTGTNVDDPKVPNIKGPEILIRHPLWTASILRQDIPVMIFTPSQWGLIQQEKLSLGAAPIGPSELGRNANYIFAIPARYNFAFPIGFEEVEKIIADKSFMTF